MFKGVKCPKKRKDYLLKRLFSYLSQFLAVIINQ